jgi:hypothetical protein
MLQRGLIFNQHIDSSWEESGQLFPRCTRSALYLLEGLTGSFPVLSLSFRSTLEGYSQFTARRVMPTRLPLNRFHQSTNTNNKPGSFATRQHAPNIY